MRVQNLYHGGWASNCYYLVDRRGEFAVVIDPSVPPTCLDICGDGQPKLVAIILTHAHYDHMLYLDDWRKTGAPVYLGAGDVQGMTDPDYNVSGRVFGDPKTYGAADVLLRDGDTIIFGDETLTVYETPGHTEGCISLGCQSALFTGDTMFAYGSIGRCDLPGSSHDKMQASLSRLLAFPSQTKIYPGHGPVSTIAAEREIHLF